MISSGSAALTILCSTPAGIFVALLIQVNAQQLASLLSLLS